MPSTLYWRRKASRVTGTSSLVSVVVPRPSLPGALRSRLAAGGAVACCAAGRLARACPNPRLSRLGWYVD